MATQTQSLSKNTGDLTMRKLTYGSIVVGVLIGLFIWQQRPLSKAKPKPTPPAPGMRQEMLRGMVPGSSGMSSTPGSAGMSMNRMSSMNASPRNPGMALIPMQSGPGRGGRGGEPAQRIPQPVSRYFANLAAEAGPFTVSVRQVMDREAKMDLYNNRPVTLPRPPLNRCEVSLQIMSRDAAALQRVSEFATPLVYMDDRNVRHESQESGPVQSFDNGLARIVNINRASQASRYLKYIEGHITLKPMGANAAEEKIPFRIENIPLPVENHFYGVAAAAYLSPTVTALVERPPTPNELRGSEIQSIESHFPPFTPDPNPLGVPNRLMMLSDAPNRFLVHLPDGKALRCTLTLTPRTDGELAAICLLEPANGGASVQRTVTLWDDEPLALLYPEDALFPKASGNRTLALRLHLYSQLLMEWIPTASPFPASKGERGGTITGVVRVGKEPVCRGEARLEMERLDGGTHAHKGAVQIEMLLDDAGRFCVANLSPGLYRLRVIEVTPYRSDVVALSSPRDALCRRYGLREPALPNALQDKVRVRSGAEVRLAPLVVTEGAKVAGSAQP